MNRHRILHLRASNFVGGPEHQLLRYAKSEREGAWDIRLGTFVGSSEGVDFQRAIEARGLSAISLPAGSLGSALQALVQAVRRENIELICAHGYRSDILGMLVGRSTGVPVACFLRGWIGENRKVRFYEALDRFAIRFADRVVCLSGSQAAKFPARSSLTRKIRIICNAIDVAALDEGARFHARNELRRRFGLSQRCVVVATAGRLSPEKGVEDFLHAVSNLADRFPDVRFIVFGEGVLREQLESRAHSLRVQDQVIFAGFHHNLRSLLPGLDLLVNPSLSEEMPNIVLEGMAAGIPVIATAVGGVEEIAGPEGAIRLVPPASPKILAAAIGELLGEPATANNFGQAGSKRVELAYSLAEQRSRFHNLYRELIPSAKVNSASDANRIAGEKIAAKCHSGILSGGEEKFLSVVIPVRNEESNVGAVLAQLEGQDYPHDHLEILVVDGDSTDRTAEVVQEFAKNASIPTQLLPNPEELSSAGRNVGARNARGEFVIYIDGHCQIPSKTLLRDAVELFTKTGADCLCRPQPLTMSSNTTFQNVVAHARATLLGHGRDSTIYAEDWEGPVNPSSSGALYRRNVFDRVGFFDERLDACEDVEFNHRVFKAGLHSYFSPKLSVIYQPRSDLKSLWKQMWRYGCGRCRLILKHPDAFSVPQTIPPAFLVWLGIGGIASFFSWHFAELFLVTLAIYFGVVFAFSLRLALRYGWTHLMLAPVVYAGIHLGLGAGFLAEYLGAGWGRSPFYGKRSDGSSIRVIHQNANLRQSEIRERDSNAV